MSQPRTADEYLAVLNASLEVGLRSRRRILTEIEDHLRQATEQHLQCGADPRQVQQQAIAAFGSPEEVAARLDAGLIGALDRRLALSMRRLHRWMTQGRSGVVVLGVALAWLSAAAFAALGASFGRNPWGAASAFLMFGIVWALFYAGSRSARRSLRDTAKSQPVGSLFLPLVVAYPATMSCLELLAGTDVFTSWRLVPLVALVYVPFVVSRWLIDGAVERAAGRYAGATDDARRQAWSAHHPWRSAVAGVAPLPLGLVTLITVHPGPVAMRVALVVLVTATAALTLAVVRLEAARRERDAYQRAFMRRLTSTSTRSTTWLPAARRD